MYKVVGYIGVRTVAINEEWYDDFVTIEAEDPANEVGSYLEEFGGSFLGAWRKAIRYINEHGGVVLERPPRVIRPEPRRRDVGMSKDGLRVYPHPFHDGIDFPSKQKAKKYYRRHAREIAREWAKWDF